MENSRIRSAIGADNVWLTVAIVQRGFARWTCPAFSNSLVTRLITTAKHHSSGEIVMHCYSNRNRASKLISAGSRLARLALYATASAMLSAGACSQYRQV